MKNPPHKSVFATIVLATLSVNALAWYPPDPALRAFYDYVGKAKIGSAMDCEGEWNMRYPLDTATFNCSTPRLPKRPSELIELRNFGMNGWEVVNREILPLVTNHAPNGVDGWRKVLIRVKKVEAVKEYEDSSMGPMRKP